MKRKLLIALAFVFSVFVLTEIFFRVSFLGRNPVQVAVDKYMQFLGERINTQWARLTTEGPTDSDHPLEPPLKVVANTNFEDAARLAEIAESSRKLKNTKLTSFDFLKDRKLAQETQYTACYNNLGFRRCSDISVEKPKNTKRIIVYGTYTAFGHGVNEELTYSNQLENLLNKNSKNNTKYEVLNSGKHAGTAILALAQFTQDVKNLKPDVIVLDYGFVDILIADDDVFPLVLLFGDGQIAKSLVKTHSFMVNNFVTFFLMWQKSSFSLIPERIEQLRAIFRKTIQLAAENKVSVVLLRQQTVRIRPKFYESIAEKVPQLVRFVDGEKYFSEQHQRYVHAPMPSHYWWNEISAEDQKLLVQDDYFKYPYLRLDLFQLNANGHALIAEALEKEVTSILSKK